MVKSIALILALGLFVNSLVSVPYTAFADEQQSGEIVAENITAEENAAEISEETDVQQALSENPAEEIAQESSAPESPEADTEGTDVPADNGNKSGEGAVDGSAELTPEAETENPAEKTEKDAAPENNTPASDDDTQKENSKTNESSGEKSSQEKTDTDSKAAADKETGSKSTSDTDEKSGNKTPADSDKKSDDKTAADAEKKSGDKTAADGKTGSKDKTGTDKKEEQTISKLEKTLTASDGNQYKITVAYDAAAKIPDGATLEAAEVSERESEEYLKKTADALNWNDDDVVFYSRFFDISIVSKGKEVQPAAPVEVTIRLTDVAETSAKTEKAAQALQVVHFEGSGSAATAQEMATTAETNRTACDITFETEGFSVFGIGGIASRLLDWITDAVSVTVLGIAGLFSASYTPITVTGLEEGLEVVEAYSVSGPKPLWIQIAYKAKEALGSRESVNVYATEGSKLDDVLKENVENGDEMTVSLNSVDGFAIVKDTGLRHLSLESGNVALDGMMPKDAEIKVDDVLESEPIQALPEDEKETVLAAYDISIREGKKNYQPDADHPIEVAITAESITKDSDLSVWHIKDDGTKEEIKDFTLEEGKISFEAKGFSVYAVAETILETTIELEGQTYKVTAAYDEHAGIPGDAKLSVSEMDVSDKEYVQYLNDTAKALGVTAGELGYLRMLDISIVGKDGTEYKPDDQVKITVELMDELDSDDLRVVHFGKKTEEINAKTEGDTVTFTTDSFSVFSFVDLTIIQNVVDAVFGSTYTDKKYENDDIIVSGRMPRTAIVEVNPAEVEIEGEDVLVAYDIKIYAGLITKALGIAWQPTDGALTVQMKSDALEGREDVTVYHYADDSTLPEKVTDAEVTENSVEFQADSFSVYALGGQHLRTYRFFTYNADMEYVEYTLYTDTGATTFTQSIKNAREGLVVPQLPSIPGSSTSTFSGWYVGTGVSNSGDVYTYSSISDEPFDFNNIPEVTETETVYLFAGFADYAYVVFHDQFNGSSNSFPVAMTRRGEKTDGTAEIQIGDFSVAYDDDSGENSAPSMAFYGWSYTPITTAGSDTDDVGQPVSKIATDSISITKNTDLYPIFKPIHWLNYYSGPTGSGATYIPSTYYYVGEGPTSLSVPVRSGYSFDGWYTGSVTTTDNGDGTTTETVNYSVKVANSDGSLINGASDAANGVSVSGGQLLLTENATIYAKWNVAETKYAVVFWRQSIDDDKDALDADKTYDFAESVVLDAMTGTTVNVPSSVPGYDQKATSGTYYDTEYRGFHYSRCDVAATVSGDGSTVLNVYYDRDLITFRFITRTFTSDNNGNYYYQNGRAYILRNSGRNNYLLNGTYNGYTFYPNDRTVIYSDTRGTVATSINYNTTYYAKYTTNNQYVYVALTWSPYNVNRYSLTESVETYTGLFGQQLSKYGYNWPSTYAWYSETNDSLNTNYLAPTRYEFSEEVVAIRAAEYSDPIELQYYFQTVEGSEPDYDENPNSSRIYDSGTITYPSVHRYMFNGFVPVKYKKGSEDWVTITNWNEQISVDATVKVYYERIPQTITFVDSRKTTTEFGTKTVLYGATTEALAAPESPYPGYSFTGWYYDADCTIKVDFAKPIDADLIVYAGWETIWYKIIIDPNYGAINGSGSTWFWEPYNGNPIEEYTWATRDYVESPSGTYFYHYDDRSAHGWGDEWTSAEDDDKQRDAYYTTNQGDATDQSRTFKYAENAYRYAGWYEVDPETGEETLYNFGEPVTHDTYLILHWKKIGTYHVQYNPVVTQDGETISGTIDNNDSNETLFFELDGDDYADNAEVVVGRVAKAPAGYNFIGWKIRGDSSGRIYEPGQTFMFLSKYAVTMPQGETIFLDAVYTRVKTAKIVYDANGGTIVPASLDYGEPTDPDAPTPTKSCDAAAGTATIENLVNNSEIRLSNGDGFSMPNATLVGWSESAAYDPDTDTLFDLDTDYYVDTEEPVKLYAVWEVKVYYHLNESTANANFGGEWDQTVYTKEADDLYSRKVYVNNVIDQPEYDPEFYNPNNPDNLFFHYWGTMRYAGGDIVEYDFSQPVTGELHLYAYWDGPIKVPVHAVDASAETLVDKDNPWLTTQPQTMIEVAGEEISLATKANADVYAANVPSGYAYAFAALKSRTADLQTISEDQAIIALYYNSSAKQVYVKYADGRDDAPLADTDETYLVYYKDPLNLNIGYKVMSTSGELSNASLRNNAGNPTTASAGTYIMNNVVTGPLSYKATNANYLYYSYAIGAPGATNASQLQLITTSSDSDGNRPQLQVRNTWRGYQYSTDGGNTWVSCGYDGSIQLYVVYFETDSQPTIVTINEKTIGTQADMSEEFEYTVTIETITTTTTSQERRTRTRRSSWSSWGAWENYSPYGTPSVTTETTSNNSAFSLSDGEQKSETIFYTSTSTSSEAEATTSGNTQSQIRTTTTIVTTQTITITQQPKTGFTTSNEATVGTSTQPYTWTYTTTSTSAAPSVTYTNIHTPLTVDVHVALVGGSGITLDDAERASNHTITLDIDRPEDEANIKAFLTEITAEDLFTGDNTTYGFAGIVYGTSGTSQGDVVTVAGTDVNSIVYKQRYPSDVSRDNIYELTLLDNDSETLDQLGSYKVYYLYYPLPKVQYVKESAGGVLTPVVTDGANPLNSGNTITLNGTTVTQNQMLPVTTSVFTITQNTPGTATNDFFNMPLLLDDTTVSPAVLNFLRYTKLGAGGAGATNSSQLSTTDTRTMMLKVDGGQVKWSLDGLTWNTFTGVPTIYAIYSEIGYELRITKTVTGEGADPTRTFTLTISSTAITESSYAVTGTGYPTVSATPGNGSTPGTITLTIQHGSDITISGLSRGDYTIQESAGAILSARIGSSEQTVHDNCVDLTLNENIKLDLTNEMKLPAPTDVKTTNTPFKTTFLLGVIIAAIALMPAALRRRKMRGGGER